MYGTHTDRGSATSQANLGQIEINPIKDREGVFLRNALIDRFYTDGYPSNPRYRLEIGELSEINTDLDITSSSEATRAQLSQSTTMKLFDLQNPGTPVLTRALSSITSYNILESEFATRVSEQKAREGGLDDLARQIELNATLYFNRTAK